MNSEPSGWPERRRAFQHWQDEPNHSFYQWEDQKKTDGSPILFDGVRETGDSNQREKKTSELCAQPLRVRLSSKAMTDISKGEKKAAVGKLRIDSQRI